MGKTVLAIALGAAVGLLLAAILGWLTVYVFPPSVLVDMDPAKARTMPMPFAEIFFQLVGWIIAGVAGGYIAARQGEAGEWPAWATGGVMALGVVAFSFFRPHPIWFVVLCILAVAAAGFGAGRLAMRFEGEPEGA
jgi:hypothetical protein